MTAVAVARKEFADTARSRMLWGLGGVLVVLTVVGLVALDRVVEGMTVTTATHAVTLPTMQLLPLAALVAGYLAVAGERESGSIRVLLGLPLTRRDVVLGKWVGRTAVVAVAVVAAFLAGSATILVLYGDLLVVDLLTIAALTTLFALAYVGIAVGISALVASRSRAMPLAVAVFAVFALLWEVVPMGALYLVEGRLPTGGGTVPGWYIFLQNLNPANAYDAARNFLVEAPQSSVLVTTSGTQESGTTTVGQVVQGSVPVYAQDWFGLVILLAWVVVPVAVGYLRFRGADLG